MFDRGGHQHNHSNQQRDICLLTPSNTSLKLDPIVHAMGFFFGSACTGSNNPLNHWRDRGVWLFVQLQMYRPPALNRSILKLFCRLRFQKRARHDGNYLDDAIGKRFLPLRSYIDLGDIAEGVCEIFVLRARMGHYTPRICIYNAAIFFYFF